MFWWFVCSFSDLGSYPAAAKTFSTGFTLKKKSNNSLKSLYFARFEPELIMPDHWWQFVCLFPILFRLGQKRVKEERTLLPMYAPNPWIQNLSRILSSIWIFKIMASVARRSKFAPFWRFFKCPRRILVKIMGIFPFIEKFSIIRKFS